MSNHIHKKTDELYVFAIPADTDQPMEMKVIPNKWEAMSKLVGGYIEVVRTEYIPELYCGCRMVMVVDDEGLLKQKPANTRASIFYPGYDSIVGDVFLVGEGMVNGEPDFFCLPQTLSTWEGPGNPLPPQSQPWENAE